MCSGSKVELKSCEMDAKAPQDKAVISLKTSSNLLELAAMDDLPAFVHEVEVRGCDADGTSFWYGRSFGKKKMGVEERTPIMVASLYGSTQVLDYIVRTKRVDVNRACGYDGATALHCAAAGGAFSCVEVVEILLEASADVNALDADGKKPGDLIAPSVKSSTCPRKRTLEMLLNGVVSEENNSDDQETPAKKEYYPPADVTLPDINTGVYGSDEFRMYSFKVKPCSRAYSHDWTECPFAHPGENARRRDPRKHHYTCVPCPDFKKGNCPKSDNCEYAHGVFESWLHPAQYRTRLCKDETGCSRKVCFFAHKPEELRPVYASTGSGLPSPKSSTLANSLDMASIMSPLSFASPPMSPISCSSSPMSGGSLWLGKAGLTPPALQLPVSRLKTALNARDMVDSDKVMTQQQMMIEEMGGNLSSPYSSRISDVRPTNLEEVFGRQSTLRASYPSNIASSSPVRKLPAGAGAAYGGGGFDSSAAVAQALMNARSSAFAKRSQSFADRSIGGYRSSSSPLLPSAKFSEWGSPGGRVDWGFNGQDDASKLRKSASFGIRSGDMTVLPSSDEPDVSWVSSLVRDVPFVGGGGGNNNDNGGDEHRWFDQMYIEQEQIVA